MLVSLRVRDFAVLEDVEVPFGKGLTVLTGETGAGKSLVVDAVALLGGMRGDAALIRAGAERAVVEGLFESDDPAVRDALESAGLASGGGDDGSFEVVVRREVAREGRGRVFVNGSPAVLRTLADASVRLLVLYGQAEARELLDPAAPRELLDRFGGHGEASGAVERAFRGVREAKEALERIAAAATDGPRRLDLLEFQLGEIDAVSPVAGEEEALATERVSLSSVERSGRLLSEALSALEAEEGGALTALGMARRSLAILAEADLSHAARAQDASELAERVADLAATLSRSLARLEADPERMEAVVSRLDSLARLKRKYGGTLREVLDFRERASRERNELSDLEGAHRKAEASLAAAIAVYAAAARELSAARARSAPRLSGAVETHLRDLAFLKASFRVELSTHPEPGGALDLGGGSVAFGPHGVDQVTFAFEPNPGEGLRPLARIASGGELSRVQLAIAAALAGEETEREEEGRTASPSHRRGPVRTFVFDEVDAGVSGAVAEAVGRKLRTLARREQILVVTHLPQVAAAGTAHLFVSKEARGGRTRTQVRALGEEGRVEAIASMLAGASVTEAARRHARELLQASRSAPQRRS